MRLSVWAQTTKTRHIKVARRFFVFLSTQDAKLVANLAGDATNWKTVRLIAAVLWVDVGAAEVQVPSVGA